MIKRTSIVLMAVLGLQAVQASPAADSLNMQLSIPKMFELANRHSRKLTISKEEIEISKQQTDIARSASLPEIAAGAQLGYISDASTWDYKLGHRESVSMPHVSNEFSIEASQIVYQGSKQKNKIAKASLLEDMASVNYEKEQEDIRFLLVGKYFDLYRLYNHMTVYNENIQLAQQRLKNIRQLRKEGMVTQNDIIRSELQISNLEVKKDEANNDISILNRELCVILGIAENTVLRIDTSFAQTDTRSLDREQSLSTAYEEAPDMKLSHSREELAKKNIAIARAEWFPSVSLYAGTMLQRPFLYSIPPQDIYLNFFQTGLKVSYNISSLYHAREHVDLARMEQKKTLSESDYVKERIGLDVNRAYTKWKEAQNNYRAYEKSYQLANSNYKIVEAKYYNQFGVLTDMLDASSAKLSAELELDNARANILFRWYQLQKATGQLNTLPHDK